MSRILSIRKYSAFPLTKRVSSSTVAAVDILLWKMSPAVLCSSFGSLYTSPNIVTLAFASPPHPGICITRLHLGSSIMFRVWIARGESANIGHPAPSAAKSTIVPNGYPARRWFIVDITCSFGCCCFVDLVSDFLWMDGP